MDADSNVDTTEENLVKDVPDEIIDKKKKKEKQKVGFRDRKVFLNEYFII